MGYLDMKPKMLGLGLALGLSIFANQARAENTNANWWWPTSNKNQKVDDLNRLISIGLKFTKALEIPANSTDLVLKDPSGRAGEECILRVVREDYRHKKVIPAGQELAADIRASSIGQHGAKDLSKVVLREWDFDPVQPIDDTENTYLICSFDSQTADKALTAIERILGANGITMKKYTIARSAARPAEDFIAVDPNAVKPTH